MRYPLPWLVPSPPVTVALLVPRFDKKRDVGYGEENQRRDADEVRRVKMQLHK